MKSKMPKEETKIVSFKVSKTKIQEVDNLANILNMNRSDYLRNLVEDRTLNYYTDSPELMKIGSSLSTTINKIKVKHPNFDFSELEKGVNEICAILNS